MKNDNNKIASPPAIFQHYQKVRTYQSKRGWRCQWQLRKQTQDLHQAF